MMREATGARAFTLGSAMPFGNQLHVAFDNKPRLLGLGLSQLLLDRGTLRVAVVNLHVGPLSPRSALARRLEEAGFSVEVDFGQNSMTVFCDINDESESYVEVPLRR